MKKILALFLLLAISLTTFSGCSSKSSNDGVTKIRFATWDSADDLTEQQKLVDDFNASQDKIVVTLEAYGDDYDTKISAGMGANDAPDVMYMWNYPAYHDGLEPLDSYMEKEGADFKSGYYDALWEYNMINDAVYGMPVGFTTHALYYNKDAFAKAGIDEPTNDWTWDDLQTAAKTITEKVDGMTGFSYQIKPDPYDFEMYLWSNGTAYTDDAGSLDGNLNSDKSVEVITMFQDMQKDKIAVATEGSGRDEFGGGKSAMFIYGQWGVSNFNDLGLNYGIVEIPSFASSGQDSVSILSSSGVSISKDSKNKDAAWEFIKYWTGEELNKVRIDYELPTLMSVVESENVMSDPQKAPFYDMLEKSGGYTPTSFKVDDWSEVSAKLELAFETAFNPSSLADVKGLLDEAVSE